MEPRATCVTLLRASCRCIGGECRTNTHLSQSPASLRAVEMTHPFSLSVGIITLFKETYLVANYIHKTVNSAKHNEEKQKEIASKIRWELLVFQSFGRYFS